MKLRYLGRTLASGALFYVIAAACSSDRGGDANGDGGVGSTIDALLDGVVDPVTEASAEEAEIVTEPCDKQGTAGGTTNVYAVHNYPQKTLQELSRIRVLAHNDPGYAATPNIANNIFNNQMTIPILRQGAVAVYCGAPNGLIYDNVTFILPK